MIIITYKPGRLANQLFYFTHFASGVLNSKTKMISYSIAEMKAGFPNLNNEFLKKMSDGQFRIGQSSISYFVNRLLFSLGKRIKNPWIKTITVGWEESKYVQEVISLSSSGKTRVYVDGWKFRDYESEIQWQHLFKKIFMPADYAVKYVNNLLKKNNDENNIVIGVHIRLTDYYRFCNRKFFYSSQQYLSVMKQARELFPDKKIKFMLCSDENINESDYSDVDFFCSRGDELCDLYALSRCNYIMGPPSTYSAWAAYFGDIPLYIIENPENKIRLESFKKGGIKNYDEVISKTFIEALRLQEKGFFAEVTKPRD
ncbi:MAG: alpha-1,2-fucosyltransferase [Bacteroidota bacterium]